MRLQLKIITPDQCDIEAISELVLNTASIQLRHEFSDEGWQLFLQLLSSKTQQGMIRNKKFRYLVAIADETTGDKKISGVLAIKDRNHLFHFFVKPECQGKGIGKALWKTYLQQIKKEASKFRFLQKPFDEVTVNSSDFAIPFYLNLGFVMVSGRQKKNGICYTPMVYSLVDYPE